MRDQDPNKNWQLESDGESEDKWILQESEQRLSDPWELQSTPSDEISGWQPVEYVKPQRSIGSWLLPTVITIALLVVLGYTGYRVLPTVIGGPGEEGTQDEVAAVTGTASPEAEAGTEGEETDGTPVAGENGAEPGEETAPAAEQEPTTEPSEPTAAPTPLEQTAPTPTPGESGTVQQEFATVNSTFGVNARFQPTADAAIIRILEENEEVFVFSEQGEWLEVFVADTPLAPGEPFSGTVGFAASEFFDIETREISQQLRTEILDYTDKLPTATPEPAPTADTDGDEDGADDSDSSTQLTVTVNALNGVNLRQAPDATQDNIIRLMENGAVVPAIARNDDTSWLLVEAPDGAEGWVAADFVLPSGDLTALPVFGDDEAATTSPTSPPAADVEAGDIVTSGVEPGAPYTNIIDEDEPAIIASVAGGVNARTAPDLESEVESVVPEGAVVPAIGRSADGLWVQITLPTGVDAWVFRDTVNVTPPVGALPAVETDEPEATPTTAEPVLLPTPTPTSEPTEPEPVTATVLPFYLPVYPEPSAEGESMGRVSRNTVLTVVGRTADSEWIQVQQDDGTAGWVATGNVQIDGDLANVAVTE